MRDSYEEQETLEIISGQTLRVLMIISRPNGLSDVNYRAIARPLFERIVEVAGKVEIELVRPPSFSELRSRLLTAKEAGRPFQILHFDGHGSFQQDSMGRRQGRLLFERHGAEQPVSAEKFSSLVREANVPLIVLNACRSGMLEAEVGPDVSIATRLIQDGTATVVAMGFAVYVQAAAKFIAAFYESLFQGQTVAQAVARGRRLLRRHPLRPSPKGQLPLQDWYVPVLYGRHSVVFSALKLENAPCRQSLSPVTTLCQQHEQKRNSANELYPLASTGHFVGRDREFYLLEQALGRTPIVLLHGIAGVGKSDPGLRSLEHALE